MGILHSHTKLLFLGILTYTHFERLLGLLNNGYILDESFVDQLCYSSLITFEVPARSVAECASLCTLTEDCNSVIVQNTTNACFGLTIPYACWGQATLLQGAHFYAQEGAVPSCEISDPLVDGTTGVTDDQITASSSLNASHAAANCRWTSDNFWVVGIPNTIQYIQIFKGNTFHNTPVRLTLARPVVAKCVRLNPRSWVYQIAMKLELFGC